MMYEIGFDYYVLRLLNTLPQKYTEILRVVHIKQWDNISIGETCETICSHLLDHAHIDCLSFH